MTVYTAQIVRDFVASQELGRESLASLQPEHAAELQAHLGGQIGGYATFATTFYDIAHQGVILESGGSDLSMPTRRQAARNGILMAGWLELIDDTIDHPNSARTAEGVERFLDDCTDTALGGQEPKTLLKNFNPARQLACLGIARSIHGQLELTRSDRREAIARTLMPLKTAALEQPTTTSYDRLLAITQEITGACTELTAMTGEFADNTTNLPARQAAWWFGALSGVLDHGSEILSDIKEGSSTFATAYLQKHGVSERTLGELRTMRKDTAADCYTSGRATLEVRQQQTIYRLAAGLLVARYAIRRRQEAITPQKIEAAFTAFDRKAK